MAVIKNKGKHRDGAGWLKGDGNIVKFQREWRVVISALQMSKIKLSTAL